VLEDFCLTSLEPASLGSMNGIGMILSHGCITCLNTFSPLL
jgi:hypothetical protein